MPSTGTRTATIVNIDTQRQLHVAEPIAAQQRISNAEQLSDLLQQFNEVWEKKVDIENIMTSGEVTTEQREQLGGLYWLCSSMRSRLNDLLYLSEFAEEGYVPPNKRQNPGAHDFPSSNQQNTR